MSNRQKYLEKLKEFIAIPSVSAKQQSQSAAAQFLRETLHEAGAQVVVDGEFGAPFVFAKFVSNKPNAKTLVLYNHYDVQPEEPLELWLSQPFVLTERDGKLFGRGVDDDKGHITSRLTAITDYLENHKSLPVNIYWIIEGAEETASLGLDKYLEKYQDEFQNDDLVIWESGEVHSNDRVEIVGGNKGIITFDLSATSANDDFHSSYASVADSATWHLIEAIASLRNDDGSIAIEGLYDDAIEPNERELELVSHSEITPDSIKKEFGLKLPLLTETSGEDFNDNLYFKSNLNIEGIVSGYIGTGVKTVTPAHATAKMEIRLVPGQVPDDIFQKLVSQLQKNGFSDIEAKLTLGEPGYRSDMSAPAILKLIEIAKKLYHGADVYPTSAGTGPMYYANKFIKAPIATAGIGYDGSLDHAPNENIRIEDYDKHIKLIEELIASYE
ncbi:MAG: M20/M25/M40 family metallo-hydrolase [Lactobacillaceae bacterium]|jgi:succinyl-diaminopimelate desuccinylase|nr:M20/M25/M40 family metallo-hydrolase [Lactobacillaceae bacterium]